MRQALLYETPEEFACMMISHLEERLGMPQVPQKDREGDPLLLRIAIGAGEGEEIEVSLHRAFQTYQNSGDFNTAIDFLNGVISCSDLCLNQDEVLRIDPSYVYPALRDNAYVEQAGNGVGMITDEIVPGMSVIFLEIKTGNNKIVSKSMLDSNPLLTVEKVKRIGYRNLRSEGWTKPRLVLRSPTKTTCTVDVYTDNPFPVECQFLNSEWVQEHMPESFLIAFTNRKQLLVMRSTEAINSEVTAIRLAKKAKFTDVVRRSYLVMPQPVSGQIYWVNQGRFHLLNIG